MNNDHFGQSSDSLISPAQRCFAIVPDDQSELDMVTKAIYVGVGGDITLQSKESAEDVTFRNVPTGAILDVRVLAVRTTGTTASAIVGLA